MRLVPADDPILRRVCRVDFRVSLRQINNMFFLLREKGGWGLAAPQVGIDARLFVTAWGEVFINPIITGRLDPAESEEGCLSLPGVVARKHRWQHILLADGTEYDGMQAITIQHEINHLDGTLITDP